MCLFSLAFSLLQLKVLKQWDSKYLFFPVIEGQSMDYGEVSSTFSKLVETHFLQRCPPVGGAGTSGTAPPPEAPAVAVSTALPTPESFPECYTIPQVTLIGRGKRQLVPEEGEDQRNAKRAKMDSEVSEYLVLSIISNFTWILVFSNVVDVLFYFCYFSQTHGDEGIYWQVNFERFHQHFRDQAIISAVANKLDQVRFPHHCSKKLATYLRCTLVFPRYSLDESYL